MTLPATSETPSTSTSERTGPIWRGGKLTHGDDEAPEQLVAGVVGDLRRRAARPELLAEVDRQLPGGLARLGEVLDLDDAADAHVDLEEVVERDHGATVSRHARAPACSAAPGSARGSRGVGCRRTRARARASRPARRSGGRDRRRARGGGRRGHRRRDRGHGAPESAGSDRRRLRGRRRPCRRSSPAVPVVSGGRTVVSPSCCAAGATGAPRRAPASASGGRLRGSASPGSAVVRLAAFSSAAAPWRSAAAVAARTTGRPAPAAWGAAAGAAARRPRRLGAVSAPAARCATWLDLDGAGRDDRGGGEPGGGLAATALDAGRAWRRARGAPRPRTGRPRRRRSGRGGRAEVGEDDLLEQQQRPDREDGGERLVGLAQLLAERLAALAAGARGGAPARSCGAGPRRPRRARRAPPRSESCRASAASASDTRARTSSDLTDGTVVSIASAIWS